MRTDNANMSVDLYPHLPALLKLYEIQKNDIYEYKGHKNTSLLVFF